MNYYTVTLADAMGLHNSHFCPHSIVHYIILEPDSLTVAFIVVLMGNTSLLVKWQSMCPVKIFLMNQVFTGTQMDLMEILIL